jgi:hypothetical protein
MNYWYCSDSDVFIRNIERKEIYHAKGNTIVDAKDALQIIVKLVLENTKIFIIESYLHRALLENF